ncbi:hypothetical protein [Photobacterium atrarenae]|uniref:DUF2946 domain-containing protein n=1 Tax=Photobacterium atrarenae TaxID=865757 RepID=A0ABY5GJI0_9GAMM|nr:hypothetical protein [Photobacterium atrarenae]UTV29073.1 hypothetical protein NNL38_07555 [Photobacterium atrarenae]
MTNKMDASSVKPHCVFAKFAVLIALCAILVSPVFAGHGLPSPSFLQPYPSQAMPACCDHPVMSTVLGCHHAMSDPDASQASPCQNADCHTCSVPFAILTDHTLLTSPAVSPQFTEPVSHSHFLHEPLDRPPIDA